MCDRTYARVPMYQCITLPLFVFECTGVYLSGVRPWAGYVSPALGARADLVEKLNHLALSAPFCLGKRRATVLRPKRRGDLLIRIEKIRIEKTDPNPAPSNASSNPNRTLTLTLDHLHDANLTKGL